MPIIVPGQPPEPDPFDPVGGAELIARLCPWWPWVPTVLPIGRLTVERYEPSQPGIGFQRSRSDRYVETAVREFQAAFVNMPKCALIDDGRLDRGLSPSELPASVLDGGHTVAIEDRRGYTEVPVLLYRGYPTYQERARLFYEHNERRRALQVSERFAGRYEGDDETAHGLLTLLDAHGFYLHNFRNESSNGAHRLEALPALFNCYREHPAALDKALTSLEAWKQHGNGYRGVERTVVYALTALARSERFDPSRMRTILDRRGPNYLVNLALRLDAGRTSKPTPRTMTMALMEEYNKRLSSNRRLGEEEE